MVNRSPLELVRGSFGRGEGLSGGAGTTRVTSIELFFDLVFVFTITQLTHQLVDHLTPSGYLQVGLIFVVLFWMYGAFAWATNQVPPDRIGRQFLLLAAMAGFLICALAIPQSFSDSGLIFGLGYLWVVIVHTVMFSLLFGRSVVLFAPLNALSALFVIGAAFIDQPLSYLFWMLAIVCQLGPGILAPRSGQFNVVPGHFVERHGLLLIVALGESFISIGAGIDTGELDAGLVAASVLALCLIAAMWWVYFARAPEIAEERLNSPSNAIRARVAMNGYFQSFVPLLLGVLITAAGIELALHHITESLKTADAFALAIGVGLFLFGQVAFLFTLGTPNARRRLIWPGLALSTAALGIWTIAAVEMLALLVILILFTIVETIESRHQENDMANATGA